MQILLLGLFVALYLHDSTTIVTVQSADGLTRGIEALPADTWPHLGVLPVLAIVLGPKLLLAFVYQIACMRTRRKLGTPGGQRALNWLERLTAALPLILLCLFISDLSLGALRVVRLALQHVVLIDELIVLTPTLLVAILAWWSYYPVDRRLREAVIFRHADAGRPVYPILPRSAYLSMQLRHQFGLLLLPLLAVFGWSEAMVLLGPEHRQLLSENAVVMLTPAGLLIVFILAPLVIRHVWQTAPLAQGEVRDRMLALCKQHRVRVRELLLWRTGGGMVNAAVTGMIAKVRYILLSDGLLDQVSPRAVEAVMAHEIAHVKLRHIIWMILVLLATLGTLDLAASEAIDAALGPAATSSQQADAPLINLDDPQTRTLIAAAPAFALSLWLFGWVSRRIERQADVFAARHLAISTDAKAYDATARQVFDEDSVNTMIHALQRVSELNHAPVTRKSWRHGSIAWRQAHLRSLIGQPIDNTPVDQVLLRVKALALVALALVVLVSTDGGADLTALLGS